MFITKHYIDGRWIETGKTFPVYNPADMSVLAEVCHSGAGEAEQAVIAARTAFGKWGRTMAKERAHLMNELHRLMVERRDEMARLVTMENGKVLSESYGEVDYAINFVEWFAQEARRIYGEIVPPLTEAQRLFVMREPVGVVAAITPWNFPIAMLARKVAPALAAGCTIVVKPANETPLTALLFAKLCEEAGIPAGVVNVLCGDTKAIGDVLSTSPQVSMLTFTGSTEVGKMLMAKCSGTVKKVALELGGNAPFIVFEDANLDKAVDGLLSSKLRNGGQSCICANRIFVAKPLLQDFTRIIGKKFAAIKVGDGLDETSQLGPMVSAGAVRRLTGLVDGAIEAGSMLLYSSDIAEQQAKSACFAAPTILLNKGDDLEIAKGEIFGPIVSIFPFDTEEEVVVRANNSNYGLASYFYTENKERIWRVSRNLEYGMVGINDVAISSEVACFGGVKESGLGREGGKEGIAEYLEYKYLVMHS